MNKHYPMYINGRWEDGSGERMEVRLPFDGTLSGTVPKGSLRELERAITSANAHKDDIAALPAYKRSAILLKVAELMVERQEHLAKVISSEAGKPIKEARFEVFRASQTIIASAEEAKRIGGEVIPLDAAPGGDGRLAFTIRKPLGVIAAITPFNFPCNLVCHKIGPAIAAGNSVVLKPASTTPMISLELAGLFEEAGLPGGVLNVVTGPGGSIGDALVQDPRVKMVTFTGSVEVGHRIRNLAGMKRVCLELGANSAVILEPDARMDTAIPRCVAGGFAHSGQVCIHLQRIYVHESIANSFTEQYVEAVKKLKMGHPFDETSDITSLITEKEAIRVESWIQNAVGAGAKLLTGGKRNGTAVEPTILSHVSDENVISKQEVFGPVVVIHRYRTLDEAIARVNDSRYGLQAGIYTRDIANALRAADQLHTGGVMINEVPFFRMDHMPYGGVKDSGEGREGPKYAIQEMTEMKLISVNLNG